MGAISSMEFWPLLKMLIPNLPDHTVSAQINLSIGELVKFTAQCSAGIDKEAMELIIKTKQYCLIPIDDDIDSWREYAEFLQKKYLGNSDARSLEQLIADCQRGLRETRAIIEKKFSKNAINRV